MGSQSDFKIMKDCEKILKIFKSKIQNYDCERHRTPNRMFEFAETAFKWIWRHSSWRGGSAHLPGMVASLTSLPVIGVPIESKLKGLDSLLSICQMPRGCPVATMAINGSMNAGLLAASIIGNFDEKIKSNLEKWKRLQTKSVKKRP